MIYSLLLDEATGDGSRHDARKRIDEALARPVDEVEMADYDREQMTLEVDTSDQSVWGEVYGMPE